MPKDDARRRRFPEIACLLSAGTRSARRPPKLSEVTIPTATSSASACSTWVLKRRVPSTISWKNDAPISRIKSTTRAPAGLGGTPFGADEIADQRLALGRERRVMGVERTGEARRSGSAGRPSRPQPDPGNPARKALIVEPFRFIVCNAGGKDFAFPRGSWRLKPLKLLDHRRNGVRALHACISRYALPVEQKAQEITCGDRLDLGSETFRCVTMDARKQPAFAPLVCFSSGRESALKCKSFGLQGCRARWRSSSAGRSRRPASSCFRNRPSTFKPSTEDFDECVIERPIALGIGVRRGYRRLKRGLRPDGQELRQALRRNPQR